MRKLFAGVAGTSEHEQNLSWQALSLNPLWQRVITTLNPGPSPRLVQARALQDYKILENRRNLILSAPTNGGKSLVGILVLLNAIRQGKRAVLLEPLRAIAREKLEELETLAPELGMVLGCPFVVQISTGDYRLDDEAFADPPPDHGELIIATPERFEAILRNPAFDAWVASIGALCVDEAHLIQDSQRGATLEYLITYLLCLPTPPRIVLLSASVGDAAQAQEWLAPCDVIRVTERYPTLHKQVLALTADEDTNKATCAFALDVLRDPQANLLIFVYQTRSAESLMQTLQAQLGKQGALAYHSQMSATQRQSVCAAFTTGHCRCLITTTALGLGVNLPATHVLVRDTTFFGSGKLEVQDILQMMGRAGRGNQPGYATALVRANDGWDAEALAQALQQEKLPALVSAFEPTLSDWRACNEPDTPLLATRIAAHLARRPEDGFSLEELRHFFSRSLAGQVLVPHIPKALGWLSDPQRVLVWQNEYQKYRLTVLGLKAVRAMLPLETAAGFAQLMRDLLALDASDRLLAAWQPLDHLLVLGLLYDRAPHLRVFSAALAGQVDAWMEAHSAQTPLLYRDWIVGQKGASRAAEVLGSLGIIHPENGKNTDEWARRQAYLATFHAIVLHERGQGQSVTDLQKRWHIKNLAGLEERWRDDQLWLLAGLSKLLDVRCFYYHLREECHADQERIQYVKRIFRQMQRQTYDVLDHLKYCSPLGPALKSMRRTLQGGIGHGTIQRLENAGITDLVDLTRLQVNDLTALGVRRDIAKQIYNYVRRRLL